MSKADWYELAKVIGGALIGWVIRHWGVGASLPGRKTDIGTDAG